MGLSLDNIKTLAGGSIYPPMFIKLLISRLQWLLSYPDQWLNLPLMLSFTT